MALSFLHEHLLSFLVFLPLAGGLLLAFLPLGSGGSWGALAARVTALLASGLTLALNAWLLFRFNPLEAGFQFVESQPWITSFNISYAVGVDGISLFLTLLTSFLTLLVVLWTPLSSPRLKWHLALVLLLQTALLGTFVALDLFLFYVFWELVLIPMYFLIGVWGGARRVYATVKFVIYTMAGSLLMLAAILVIIYLHYKTNGYFSSDIATLCKLRIPGGLEPWLFAAFALAFCIKVPLFPFHTWLPDAHVEAPTGGSVLLAGVLLKMGTYGLLRLAVPLFPHAAQAFMPWLAGLAIAGVVYGALVSLVQKDIKKLVAYSSVSHMGFVVLGIAAMNVSGWQGGLYQMLAHGLSTGGLFFLVGMLYERRHTRELDAYGGLAAVMPRFAATALVICLASMGLPGLNGFVGEFLILAGAYGVKPAWAAVAATGVVLAAAYLLWFYERVMLGPVRGPENSRLPDLDLREAAVLLSLVAAIVATGVYPKPILDRMQPTVERYLADVHGRMQEAQVAWNPSR